MICQRKRGGACLPRRSEFKLASHPGSEPKGSAMRNVPLALAAFVFAIVLVPGASAQIPPRSSASNVRVVGYSDVGGRPPFKLSIRQANGRWYLYAGHLWHRGWTILDVTDPAKPSVANFVPGPENTWTIQMEIGGDKMITALEKIGQGWGGDAAQPNDEGVLVWSLADPVRPQRLGQYKTGGTGTHRNFYSGGRYMHLAAGMPGYSGNIYVIVDIGDPAKPTLLSLFPLPVPPAGASYRNFCEKGGRFGPHNQNQLQHNPFVEHSDKLVYLTYFNAGLRIVDISDARAPREVGYFLPPDPTR